MATAHQAAQARPAEVDRHRCGSCNGVPGPTFVILDLPGFGHVAVCSDPSYCRRRAIAAGVWCTL